MPEAASLPLFPLHTVLVPGAALELRIFERRYLDMVRDCGRGGSGFGVCLILDGDEAGTPATPAAFGSEALIEDFDTTPDGLLSLRVRARRRFHVLRTRVRDSGLVVADIEWRDDDPASSPRLRPEHALLAELLRIFLDSPRRLITRNQMLEALGGMAGESFDRAMDVRISRLRSKLGEDPKNPRLIKTIYGAGYIFLAELG